MRDYPRITIAVSALSWGAAVEIDLVYR